MNDIRKPAGTPAGGQFAPQQRAEADTSLTPAEVELTFADGSTAMIASIKAERIVGKDHDGLLIAQNVFPNGNRMLYPLTPCCQASDKGTEDGIACRGCYRLLGDDWFGGPLEDEDIAVPIASGE